MTSEFNYTLHRATEAVEQMTTATQEFERWAAEQKAKAGSLDREPSKASLFGNGPTDEQVAGTHEPGAFIRAVMDARSRDADEQRRGKTMLAELGVGYEGEDAVRAKGSTATLTMLSPHASESMVAKSTLGLTDATGGWILPGASVDGVSKPRSAKAIYRNLMTVRSGVRTQTVDLPYRSGAPTRAVIVNWGDTKTNTNLAYNGYTATMYTLAIIYDLAKQFVKFSAGAAEQDVLEELGHAFALGENHYIRQGTGTTEPYGVVTALQNSPSTFTTAHTATSNTLAGSVASAIAKAGAALYGRHRTPEAAVMSASGFSELLNNGVDAAGFFLNGVSGPQSIPGLRVGTLIAPFGIPVYVDPDLSGDDLIVAEWSAFKIYEGDGYRVDTSDEAGDRWDKNLIGFRGEEEIGFDARPAVFSGAAQYVVDILS